MHLVRKRAGKERQQHAGSPEKVAVTRPQVLVKENNPTGRKHEQQSDPKRIDQPASPVPEQQDYGNEKNQIDPSA
jgi:hypothetical protein